MAVACAWFNNRNARVLHDRLDEPCAAARYEHVDKAAHSHELCSCLVGSVLYELHRIGRDAACGKCLLHYFHKRLVGADCLLPAAEYYCIAAFQGKRSGFSRHVW